MDKSTRTDLLSHKFGYKKSDTFAFVSSLAWPDPLRTGAYRLEIISAVLRGSGTVHGTKKFRCDQILASVNWFTW